jgi:prenyltransferase beta subunit
LASTYAAVLAIVNIGTQEAYDIIVVDKMRVFFKSIKNNLDIDLKQAHPKNMWIFADKDGEIWRHGGQAHTVVGTLPGSVAIHYNGEMDMRGVYCAMVVADILNILDEDLTRGVGEFISSC